MSVSVESEIATISEQYYQHLLARRNSQSPELWEILDNVYDPEIPVLSLWNMGILKDVFENDQCVTVVITPTYSGCPAMDQIEEDIKSEMLANGYSQVMVKKRLAPAWTTEWMSNVGREALRQYGIAAPNDSPCGGEAEITPVEGVTCPHCKSIETRRISEFSSTACKALFQCNSCSEPFDYFKSI